MDGRWYSITEMSGAYKTTLRALRFYEQEGLLSPKRTAGQRLYSEGDRIRLELILTAKRLGFTLTEIGKLIEKASAKPANEDTRHPDIFLILGQEEIGQRIECLQKKREELQHAIADLTSAAQSKALVSTE